MNSATLSASSEILSEVRALIGAFIATHGRKRGLVVAAHALDVSERRARGLLYGEARRIDATELLAVRDAARLLEDRRIAALEHELALLRAKQAR